MIAADIEPVEAPADTRGRRRIWLIGLICALLGFVATVALIPVTAHVPGSGGAPVTAPAGWEVVDLPTRTELTVENAGGDVTLRLALEAPETFNPTLISALDGFTFDESTGLFSASGPARLTVAGVFGDASWLIEAGSPRELTFQRNGDEQVRGGADLSPVLMPSPLYRLSRTSAYAFSGVSSPVPGQPVSVLLPRGSLQSSGDSISAASLLAPATASALAGWLTFAAAAVLLGLVWLVGRALFHRAEATPAAAVMRAATGLALVTGIGTGLAYVMPAKYAGWIVTALAAAAVVWALATGRLRGVGKDARAGLGPVLWALPATVILFFPVALWGGVYAGQYKTDLFFYGTLSSIAEDHSILAMQTLPEAQQWTAKAGFAIRVLDSIGVSMLTGLTNMTTVTAITVLGIMLALLLGATVVAVGQHLNNGRRGAVIAALALCNPLFVGLFVEDYYSQYWFVALVPAFLLAVHALLNPEHDFGLGRPLALWGVAGTAGFLIAVYPYFFVVVAAGVLLVAVVGPWRRTLWRQVWPVLWRTVLVANASLLTLTGFMSIEAASGTALDNIARNVLLGPFSPVQIAGLLLGVVPYQWRSEGVPVDAAMGWPGEWLWRLASSANSFGRYEIALVALVVAALLVLVAYRQSVRTYITVAAVVVFGLWMLFGAYYILGDRAYPALKGLWTGAAMVPLLFAAIRWRPGKQWWVAGLTAVLALMWVRSGVADRVEWVMDRDSQRFPYSHVQVSDDLDDVARLLRQGSGPVAVAYSAQPLSGSDQDRVVEAHAQILTRDSGRPLLPTMGVTSPDFCTGLPADTGSIVVVGVTEDASLCDRPLAYRSDLLEVFQ